MVPPDQRPAWMDGMAKPKMEEVLTKVIIDAIEASQTVGRYFDTERAKGREFDDIFAEVKPYLDHVSRPIDKDMRDGIYAPATEEFRGSVADPGVEVKAAYKELAKQPAPHRTLATWSEGVPLEPGKLASGDATPAAKERPQGPSDPLSPPDLEDSFLLVGSCNGWSPEDAQRQHQFKPSEGVDPARHEHMLRVKVPDAGLEFQILSVTRLWRWRLFPSQKTTLKAGEAAALVASVASGADADEKAVKDFRLKRSTTHGFVDIRFSLSLELGARIWFTEPQEQESLPALTYPSME